MKARILHLKLFLILILSQITITGFSQITTITEDFSITHPNHPGGDNWGTVTGVDGIQWDMYNITRATYNPPNPGDTYFAAFYHNGGYIMSRFNKAITQISFKARPYGDYIAQFEVFLNNESLGLYDFTDAANQEVTIIIDNPVKNNILKVQFVRWDRPAYARANLDDLSITFDESITDTNPYGSGYVHWIHNGFGEDPKTERWINWATPPEHTGSYVLYGENEALGLVGQDSIKTNILTDLSTDPVWDDILYHNVQLTGLTPGTTYYYRCGSDSGMSDLYSFKTAPANEEPFTFAVSADVQVDAPSVGFDLMSLYLVERGDIDFWYQLGDMVQNGGNLFEWTSFFESGRPLFENIPAMVIRGNHDHYGGDDDYVNLRSFFPYLDDYPDKKYAFEYSNSIFIGLDNTKSDESTPWLIDQLSNTTKNWKFAAWHANPYSTGGHGGDCLPDLLDTYMPPLEQYGVTTVFNGHSHAFEWTHPLAELTNPPVISYATVHSDEYATCNKSQGTLFYNGAGTTSTPILLTAPQDYTLTGDTLGEHSSVLIATVYNDSIVYTVEAYYDFSTSFYSYQKGDIVHKYVVYDIGGVNYSLTTASAGNGTVTPSGTHVYNENTDVIITANPSSGYTFSNWTGDVPGGEENTNPLTITMTADVNITANFTALPTYTLTVNSGTGSATLYEGEQATVTADTPPVGKEFDVWTGDISGLADANSASTTLTMPASDVTITATYANLPTYTLTVSNGTGSGDYLEGETVGISPNTPPTGQEFDVWTGDIAYLDNANLAAATVTMPAQAISLTAQYRDTTTATYTLTVTNGTGSGEYVEAAVVPIVANTPTAGMEFDVWTGDVTNVADVNSASTTITMPASAASVTATYVSTGPLAYTVTFTIDDGSLPVEYATITFNSETVLTDASGNAVFSNVLPGIDLAYTVAKYGYDNYSGTLTVVDIDVDESVSITLKSVGVLEGELEDIVIYPNPASDIITISNVSNVSQVKIYSMSNIMVKFYHLHDEKDLEIDISDLSKGMYIIQLVTDKGHIIRQQVLY